MNSYQIGQKAERIAAHHLRGLGYKIIGHNWRTRWCEIDLIAFKDNCVLFIEVKYRNNPRHGDGLDYITNAKLSQMHRAAESWMQKHGHLHANILAVISVEGPDFVIKNFISIV